MLGGEAEGGPVGRAMPRKPAAPDAEGLGSVRDEKDPLDSGFNYEEPA